MRGGGAGHSGSKAVGARAVPPGCRGPGCWADAARIHSCSFQTPFPVFPPPLAVSPWRGKAQREQPLALLFHEVEFPTPPSRGAAGAAGSGAAAGLPRPERALLRLNLTGGERPLPRPLPTGRTIGLPRATRSCSRPSTACHRGGDGRDSPLGPGRGTGPRPPAGRALRASPAGLRSPLPGLTCPSWRRAPGQRRAVAAGAARRDTRLGWARRLQPQRAPSGSRNPAPDPARPGPAAARAPGAWAGAAAPGDSGQHPPPAAPLPGPAHTFPIKGKKY